jgi:hypothetical protein
MLGIGAIGLSGCKKTAAPGPDVVAKIGDHRITVAQMQESMLFEPKYAIRTPLRTARESQVKYLIGRDYDYRAAESVGLANDSTVRARMNYIERQEVLKAFIHTRFLDSVRISPDEVMEGLRRFSQYLRVMNIFRKDRSEIMKIYRQLQAHPESVPGIFSTFGVDLGWITFGMIDPRLEKVAYSLKPGSYSDILSTEGGYHIIFTENAIVNNDYQQLTMQMRMDHVKEALRKRAAHAAILQFLKERAGTRKIQVNNKVVAKVAGVIDENTEDLSRNSAALQPPISGDELDIIDLDLISLSTAPIARFGEKELSVGQFLQRLKEMPPYQRPYIKGPQGLVQVLLDLMRNDMLTDAAFEQGFAARGEVQKEIQVNQRELLAQQFRTRYDDPDFRTFYPEEWQKYDATLAAVKHDFPAEIYKENLTTAGENADSLMTGAPVPVFLKNRYVW